ncbi:hypothetical protein MWU52_12755 [Jannaschia sp. S6380]|uniref:hypothetical protein n=1 Tax=Jannaschia sp. S6380 TaxID=2926408 RepID=UPI001FF6235A|nr:hypothetical protein [Jannaschia sp. S6380]MCK0168427.1 hypothetical protein [Jannaschia sp. S6380]
MIGQDDLRAAVGAGLLSEGQAASLMQLAADRGDARRAAPAGEEPFALFRGFNEIFIVVGLAILATGWIGVWTMIATASGDFRAAWMAAGIATAAVILLLSEYFIRRRRMVAPAIALATAFAVDAAGFWLLFRNSVTLLGGIDFGLAALPLALTAGTIALYWWRYRVPFAMALLATSIFGFVIVTLSAASGQAATFRDLFLLSAAGPLAWGTLILGLGLFAVAMRFDMSDPHRMTLRAANGFWLHIVAAPAIVNTVALTLIDAGTGPARLALAVLLGIIAVIAVVIDRRSFLISAVGYVVVLVSQVSGGDGFAPTVLLLGAALVGLGAGWQRIRGALLGPVPAGLKDRLPPSTPASTSGAEP